MLCIKSFTAVNGPPLLSLQGGWKLIALWSFYRGELLAEKMAEGPLDIRAARQQVGLLDRANRNGLEFLFAQFGVKVWDSCEKTIEILLHIG